MQYVSPEMAAFKPEYKSSPEGYWTWGAVIMAASPTTPSSCRANEAPKNWKDMLDPKWTDAINVKVSISGLQHVELVHAAAALWRRLLVRSSRR